VTLTDEDQQYKKTKGMVAFFVLLLIVLIELDIFPL